MKTTDQGKGILDMRESWIERALASDLVFWAFTACAIFGVVLGAVYLGASLRMAALG